ncbi:MAG: nuclear transport factor 2 family protein, partial [Sphingobium sp.]|nr:nuclear transport factor 2 family protein [Sphingobium sp.]
MNVCALLKPCGVDALALAAALAAAAPAMADPGTARTIAALESRIAATRLRIERIRAYDDIENLESAYGYYLDKNLWSQLADLFARDGSMELAQRGVYVGQDHIRAFLPAFGGPEGPRVNRLSNHLNLQPVIHVSPDGRSAKVRLRLLQMMGEAGRSAGWGAAVYENEMVKEGGVWKFKVDHAYNTYNVPYEGGWSKPNRGVLPGPNQKVPPDRPPMLVFNYFPKVYDLPIHYKNP